MSDQPGDHKPSFCYWCNEAVFGWQSKVVNHEGLAHMACWLDSVEAKKQAATEEKR